MGTRPSITVAAVIERGGRFLLVEEEDEGRIVFNQPAGAIPWLRSSSMHRPSAGGLVLLGALAGKNPDGA